MESPPTILKIRVTFAGGLTVDGVPASLEQLSATLMRVKAERGVVWYYRDEAMTDSDALAEGIMDLVVQHRLPISLSTKSDFSDYVDADGQSHPRKEII